MPPVVAVMGYFLFGETLNLYGVFGMGVAIIGVALVMRGPNQHL
jgi:drug/metabolite transporter (DMT)-like permease